MNDDLDAIRARAAAATSQPWTRFKQEIYDAQHRLLCYVNERHTSLDDEETRREDRSNAIFIAHSHADITALLALVDEQAATIARLRVALAWYADAANYATGTLYNQDEEPIGDGRSAAHWDEGERARTALDVPP